MRPTDIAARFRELPRPPEDAISGGGSRTTLPRAADFPVRPKTTNEVGGIGCVLWPHLPARPVDVPSLWPCSFRHVLRCGAARMDALGWRARWLGHVRDVHGSGWLGFPTGSGRVCNSQPYFQEDSFISPIIVKSIV